MGDVLTEIPPPSRFFQEDLSNFTPSLPRIPSPFLAFSNPKPKEPLRPSLLIISISRPSLYLFHHVTAKTLVGSLILPEIPFSGNSVEPSLGDKSCNIYAINDASCSILLVSVQCSIAAERSHMVAKSLIGDKIIPERVLILNSFQIQSFRGRLSPDETYAYKLETSCERKALADGCRDPMLLRDLDYFPSGSVVDGLPAALLAQCEIKNIRGTLGVSWPEHGPSVVAMVKSLLHMKLLPGLDTSQYGDVDEKYQQYLYT